MKIGLKCMALLLMFSFLTCEEDSFPYVPPTSEEPIEVDFTENFGGQITTNFFGRVTGEDQTPLENVTITVGNTTTTTDAFGVFSINNAQVFENFAYITAEKDGYIKGSRALVPDQNDTNQIRIILIEKEVVETIASGQSSTVNLTNGTSVSFDGNFQTAQGGSYNGQVNVIVKHLSPDDENMSEMMPGMLYAQNSSGNEVVLETYGMLAVELETTSGEPLQLAEGSRSVITMPLADSTTNAPSTIPLWYFDDSAGYWKEDGEATLQGNTYVGEVSHFTFWNYDFPYPPINLCITLRDENGNALPHTALDIYSELLNATGTYGFTNADGIECGLVPADEELTITVFTGSCEGGVFTTTIGPFNFDINTTIIVESEENITFTGNFLTCDGANVTNGYVQLTIGEDSQTIPVTNGEIEIATTTCGATSYSLQGVDLENNETTELLTGAIGDNTSEVDLSAFSACTTIEDADGDSILDIFEDLNGDNNLDNDDTDNDGTPNYLDPDDDGDGINTIDENYDGDNDPRNDDTDDDGTPNYLDNNDLNLFDAETGGSGCEPVTYNFDALFANIYNVANTEYVFYETDTDAAAQINPLTLPYTLAFVDAVLNPIIYVRATSSVTGQSDIASLFLFLNYTDSDNDGLTDCEEITGFDDPNTNLTPSGISDPNDPNDPNNASNNSPTDGFLQACDGNSDGIAQFDLISMDPTFLNGNSPNEFEVTYHLTEADAANGANQLPSLFENFTNPQILSVRVFENATGNVDIAQLTLEVVSGPTIPALDDLVECDGNADGSATFDFTTTNAAIMSANPNDDVLITYFLSEADAESDINAIANPFSYNSVNLQETIYIRVESAFSNCISVGSVDISVDTGC